MKSPLPILSNLLISAADDRLMLAASNMETTITTYVGASIEEDGSITVPAKLLKDFVTNLSPDTIDANLQNEILHLSSEKTKSRFNGTTAEDFPELPQFPKDARYLELDPQLFAATIGVVTFASGTDESRPIFTGVYLNYEDNELTVASSDGFRLSEKVHNLDSGVEKFTVVIPAKTLAEVARIFADAEEPIKFALNENENLALFASEDTLVATRILEGQYPDYKTIVPQETILTAKFPTDEFVEAVRLTSLFAKEGDNAIKIKFDPEGTIKVSSLAEETGEHESKLAAEIDGEPLELAFNSKYLLDFLNNVKSESVVLSTNGAITPCLLKPNGHEKFIHVIMPMQV
jgi:DNA polymerase-3 subunit beta